MDKIMQKYFSSEIVELKRSEINPASYNPRTISNEGRKALKRSIRKFGVVGGIIVNRQTGNTIVGGHQKVDILDEINKYPENDYNLRVELIDVDLATEKTLNVTLNNLNVGGSWDYDALREIIPDIDYKDAGFTDADLNMIGVDFMLQTEEQNSMADALAELNAPIRQEQQRLREERKAVVFDDDDDVVMEIEDTPQPKREMTQEEKIAHMKDVKKQVREDAMQKAQTSGKALTPIPSDR